MRRAALLDGATDEAAAEAAWRAYDAVFDQYGILYDLVDQEEAEMGRRMRRGMR